MSSLTGQASSTAQLPGQLQETNKLIQNSFLLTHPLCLSLPWVPACAGMTEFLQIAEDRLCSLFTLRIAAKLHHPLRVPERPLRVRHVGVLRREKLWTRAM